MSLNFHNEANRFSYSMREADPTWILKILELCNPNGKTVADIGCGGGIYSRALAEMRASKVVGIDFSEVQLKTAREASVDFPQIRFCIGEALNTGLNSEAFDLVLERALIHHLRDLIACFTEAYRILKPGGTFIIQDRTSEDCLLKGNPEHIRGYFFEVFPSLIEKESSRRPVSEQVLKSLKTVGFQACEPVQIWEVRQVYSNTSELKTDLMNRTGRSILHELTDTQLEALVEEIEDKVMKENPNKEPIVEKDRWTIWKAVKPLN